MDAPPGFGSLLRGFRIRSGLSQEALAARADLSAKAIGALEQGARRAPYRRTIAQLADALSLSATEREALDVAAGRVRSPAPNPEAEAEAAAPSVQVPRALTPFIDREEVGEIEALIGRHRFVTLTGTGGVGKTRTAIEASLRNVKLDTTVSVCFADLSAISDERLILREIASALNVTFAADDSLQILVAEVGARNVAIILDNCEHLIDAVAAIVPPLLAGCRKLSLLVTSREVLGVPGEVVYRLPSLRLPHDDIVTKEEAQTYSAIALFLQRAHDAAAHLTFDNDRIPTVIDICRRLDAIPLAIELAAARLPYASLATIRDRLNDPSFLAGGRGLAPRQRTMNATIAWSFDLLDERERFVLQRAGIFVGGFTLSAAEFTCATESSTAGMPSSTASTVFASTASSVIADTTSSVIADTTSSVIADTTSSVIADTAMSGIAHTASRSASMAAVRSDQVAGLLAQLVQKSLVNVNSLEPARYTLLEPIRVFARERLESACDVAAASLQHARWLAREADLLHENPAGEFAHLVLEIENARAAIAWCLASDVSEHAVLAARIVSGLRRIWSSTNRLDELYRYVVEILGRLEDVEENHALVARLWRARLNAGHIVTREALDEAEPFLVRGGDFEAVAMTKVQLALCEAKAGSFAEANALLASAESFFGADDRRHVRKRTHYVYGCVRAYVFYAQDDLIAARATLAALQKDARDSPIDADLVADILQLQSAIEFASGNSALAIDRCFQSLEIYEDISSASSPAWNARLTLTSYMLLSGDLDRAEYYGALVVAQRARNRAIAEEILAVQLLAAVTAERDEPRVAAIALGYLDASRVRAGIVRPWGVDAQSHEILVKSLEARLPTDEIAFLRREGAALDIDSVADLLLRSVRAPAAT